MKANIIILALISILVFSCPRLDASVLFAPFAYDQIGIKDGDLRGKFHVISGSKLGSRILQDCFSVSLIHMKERESQAASFSYSFDEKTVTKFFEITNENLDDFRELFWNPDNFGPLKKAAMAKDAHPFRTGPLDYAVEIGAEACFTRIYFSKDLSSCYFVTSNGIRGNFLVISPDMRQFMKNIIKKLTE